MQATRALTNVENPEQNPSAAGSHSNSINEYGEPENVSYIADAPLTIYLKSGKVKHPRFFWLDEQTREVSWGKTLRSKKCKTETLKRIINAPTVPDAETYFKETDRDGSGFLDREEVAQLTSERAARN